MSDQQQHAEAFDVSLTFNGQPVVPTRARCVACGAEIPAAFTLCLPCEELQDGDGIAVHFAPESF